MSRFGLRRKLSSKEEAVKLCSVSFKMFAEPRDLDVRTRYGCRLQKREPG